MRSLKITLTLTALVAVFLLTVSSVNKEKTQSITEEVKSTPSNDVIDLAINIKDKKNKPSNS